VESVVVDLAFLIQRRGEPVVLEELEQNREESTLRGTWRGPARDSHLQALLGCQLG